jgi:hypothetical protein
MTNYARRHLRFGWWSLLVYATLGLVLESFHAFKVREYLDVSNETRRLMWTLAHAHGTLLGFANVMFALTLDVLPEMQPRTRQAVSVTLVAASLLVPAGFFLGGIGAYAGDPGLATIVLPVGAVLLLIALYHIAKHSGSNRTHRRPL